MRWLLPIIVLVTLVSPARAQGIRLSFPFGWQREIGERFKADAQCNEVRTVEHEGGGRVRVEGCLRVAIYTCSKALTCTLDHLPKTSAEKRAEALRAQHRADAIARRDAEAQAKVRPRVEQQQSDKGYRILRAILPGPHLEIRVTSAPVMDASQVLWTMRFTAPRTAGAAASSECQHALVADGAAMHMPAVSSPEGQPDEYRFKLPIDSMRQLAGAGRVVGRTCELRWELNDASIKVLRELVTRIQEELALEGRAVGVPAVTKVPGETI